MLRHWTTTDARSWPGNLPLRNEPNPTELASLPMQDGHFGQTNPRLFPRATFGHFGQTNPASFQRKGSPLYFRCIISGRAAGSFCRDETNKRPALAGISLAQTQCDFAFIYIRKIK
jgi:hypothetical protein